MQKKFFFIAYLAFSIHCLGQQYPFVHYTPKDGLVNSRVRKAWQDSKGRMYFMTFGGLSIYDGVRFTNYTAQDGLASDLVNDVLEMGEDSFWIACNISSLNYLSRGTIKTFKTADGTAPTINKFIRTSNGTIYVIADEGLFVYKENRFARLPFENSHGADVGKFLIEGVKWKDFIIVLTDNSLSHLGPGNLYVFNTITNRLVAEEETKYITTAGVGNDNSIYVSDGKGTLNLLDTAALLKGKIQYIPPPARYHAVQTGIAYLHFDNNNNLWLYSTSRKVLKVDPAGFIKEFSVETGLSSNSFSGIFNDKEGSAWITMDGSGVDKLVSDYIQRYDKFGNLPVSNMYTSALTDSVYLYSWPEKKMIVVDNNGATVYEFTGTPVFPNASCVLNGNVYLADGISLFRLRLHHQKRKVETTLLYKDTGEATFGNFLADPYGNLILAGTSYITALKNYKPVYFYAVKDYIDQMTIDNRNRLWVASRAGELLVFEINPGGNKNYLQLLKSYSEIPDLSARSLTADKSGNIWIGTRSNGLYCLVLDSGLVIHSTRHYTTREGLSDNFVINLTCDPENNIWISTSSGLDRISRMGNSFRIENITRSNNIYDHVLKTLVSKNGIAWSTTVDGKLIRIGKAPVTPAYTPSLLITSLRPGNNGAPGLPESNSFSYRQNSFSVSAAAPSFYDEQQIKYSYLLKGSNNNQWSEPANTADFNFINLNPGKYTLRIKASFPAGRYPDQVIDYAFIIRPPWWQTWWFRIIAGLIVVGLLIIIVRYYYQNKLREQKAFLEKQQAVEKERTRIATDIHDDLGSGLSRIRYLGEMVKLKTSQQQNILPDIEKIAVFSDEMVDKMNEIVWALNEKNDSLDAIISYIRSFAVEYLSNNNIECKVTLPERVPIQNVKGETRRNIFLSVKECLHNTVKHAGATLVTIDISANGWLIISLHDNGRGIDWDNRRPFSNGIQNIKKRMREAGGTTDFRNDEGTTVVLAIPL